MDNGMMLRTQRAIPKRTASARFAGVCSFIFLWLIIGSGCRDSEPASTGAEQPDNRPRREISGETRVISTPDESDDMDDEHLSAPTDPGIRAVAQQSSSNRSPLPAYSNVVAPPTRIANDFSDSPELELIGNFETMGVVADIPDGYSPNDIGRMACFIMTRDGTFSSVQDLVRVKDKDWFAGSLFWLKPDSEYAVKVVVTGTKGEIIATWFKRGSTRPDIGVPDTTRAVYVSQDGSDINPGTKDRPYSTLKHAFAQATPGTTVFIRGGIWFEGGLTIPGTGTTERPIVIRSYPGERVIIDAADPDLIDIAGWEPTGNGIFRHPFSGVTLNAVIEDQDTGTVTRLFPVHSLDDLKNGRLSDFQNEGNREANAGRTDFASLGIDGAFYCDGTTVWIRPPDNANRIAVYVGNRHEGIRLENRRYVEIAGIEFRHFGKGDYSNAIMLLDSQDIRIRRCSIRYCETGIWVKGDCSRLLVEDSVFQDAVTRWNFFLVKSGQYVHVESGAVYIDQVYSGRGAVIRRNRIAGLFDGVHLCPWIRDDARTNETDFYRNVIVNVSDDFIETDGFSRNVRIFDNFMTDSLSGISLAQASDGPTYILYNAIINFGVCDAARFYEGYPFKTNGGGDSSGRVFFFQNTAYTTAPNGYAILIKSGDWVRHTFRNNVWAAPSNGFTIWHENYSPIDFDYDDLYTTDPDAPMMIIGKTAYDTLADVQKKLGYLTHGLHADPGFTDPANGDFSLTASSPCIDAGVVLPGINDGRSSGKAPDMGAYEFDVKR